jgi:hypothetical protein
MSELRKAEMEDDASIRPPWEDVSKKDGKEQVKENVALKPGERAGCFVKVFGPSFMEPLADPWPAGSAVGVSGTSHVMRSRKSGSPLLSASSSFSHTRR